MKTNPFEGLKDYQLFLYREIDRYSKIAGNQQQLSLALGHDKSYVRVIMWRDRMSGIERLWREAKKHYEH